MKFADFDALVRRIEDRYRNRRWALRARVAWLVLFGYAGFMIWFSLLLALGASALIGAVVLQTGVSFVLAIVGGFLITLGLLQAWLLLSVPLDAPKGRVLLEHEAPRFTELMNELRRSLESVRVSQVLITHDYNASVRQSPRWGIVGWKNYLSIGLPLLESLTTDEFRAVLAHEFAHLSAQHGRFDGWVYRFRATWDRVFRRLHQTPAGSFESILRTCLFAFIDRFWPRFNAYAFVLSRANEYTADSDAARIAGASSMVNALWRMECLSRMLDEAFWVKWWQQANAEPQPPAGVMQQLTTSLQTLPSSDQGERWMEQSLRQMADSADTHPSFQERVVALNFQSATLKQAGFPVAPFVSAATELLGPALDTIRADVDQLWRKEVERTWRDRHHRAQSLQHRFATLHQSVPDPESDPATLWEKIGAIVQLEGPSAAEPALRRLLELRPSHSGANLILGRHLLEQGKSEGESLLRTILENDEEEQIPGACEVLASHFRQRGDSESLREIVARLDQYHAAVRASQRERSSVSASDTFIEPELTTEEIAAVASVLEGEPRLASAWLVRKSLQHFPKQRMFVLCVRTATNWLGRSSPAADQAVADSLSQKLKLPGRLFVFAPHGGFRSLGKKVMRCPSAQVFPRNR